MAEMSDYDLARAYGVNAGRGFTAEELTLLRYNVAQTPPPQAAITPVVAPPPQVAPGTPPLVAPPTPIDPAQLAAVLYDKTIPIGFSTRAQWGGRIIEGPVFGVVNNERVASFIAGYYIPINFWDTTRTVSELYFRGQLAWSLGGGALMSGLNVGVATSGGNATVRFNTGTLSQAPDAWSIARYGVDNAIAYVPLVTATFENIRLAQFDNTVPFTSVTVDDSAYGTPGDLVAWADAIEALALYDGRGPDEFATVDVSGGLNALILGNNITFTDFLAAMRKHKPQWNVRTADKLYLVEKGLFSLDLALERAKLVGHGAQPIIVHSSDAFDKPREKICHYLDVARDYESSNVRVAEDIDPVIVTDSFNTDSYDIPVASTADIVMAETSFAYYTGEVARRQSEFSGMAYYLGLEPGDCYKWTTASGSALYHRVNEIVRRADFTIDIKGEGFLNCAIEDESPPLSAHWTNVTANTTDTDAGTNAVYSGDGSAILRAPGATAVNLSLDDGATFSNVASGQGWVAISTDGSKMAIAKSGGNTIQISTDGGTSWSTHTITGMASPPSAAPTCISMSGDGSKIAIGEQQAVGSLAGKIYISTDGGSSWTVRTPYAFTAGSHWFNIVISRDGSTIYANGPNGSVMVKSTDNGTTWTNVAPDPTPLTTTTDPGATTYHWQGLACSSDGSIVAAYETNNDLVWTSTNGGATWAQQMGASSGLGGYPLCMSDDGLTLYASGPSGDHIYKSTDGGVTWVKQDQPDNPTGYWYFISCSADGKRAVATAPGNALWVGDFT